MAEKIIYGVSLFTDYDIHLFREGRHFNLWEKFGAHIFINEKTAGVLFSVWAPNASAVFVFGDFNEWNQEEYELKNRWDGSGIFEGFIPGLSAGILYKYVIHNSSATQPILKTDPYAKKAESAPGTASIVVNSKFKWRDKKWIQKRKSIGLSNAMSIYEVHLGSWGRNTEGNFFLYRELAEHLIQYVKRTGFTHIEIMPVMEHPFYGSWGYQITNYFAPTSRYGDPDDLKYLIDTAHKNNIGVILDWVPSHFPGDAFALKDFDGTALYEHADPRKGFQPDWNSYIFNYGRNEVKSFLISNALYWIDYFHADGLRVDAVASILYLDYSRKEGEWVPNEYGGNENLDAIAMLKECNDAIQDKFPGTVTIAEESTAWPKVSQPTAEGGLGFTHKWMMGWMHDTLNYFNREPIYRKHHQDDITFSIWYFWSEHFVLSISHDEVVYGKGSLLNKMPGDEWHKYANLRLLFATMFTHPGAKTIFMGSEFAQLNEWNHNTSLDWHLLELEPHKKMLQLVTDLNHLYTSERALHENDYVTDSLVWIDITKKDECILTYKRIAADEKNYLVVVVNYDQQTHYDYHIEVPENIAYNEVLNTDADKYGGGGLINESALQPSEKEKDEKNGYFVNIIIPPLSMIILKPAYKTAKEAGKSKNNKSRKRGKKFTIKKG